MSAVHGEALSIIKFNDSASLEFNKAELDGLLLHPDVKNRKVVLLSIVGAFRKGKSFFLDYCLRYLYGHVSFKPEMSSNFKLFIHSINQSNTPKILWMIASAGWACQKTPFKVSLGGREQLERPPASSSGLMYFFMTNRMEKSSRFL